MNNIAEFYHNKKVLLTGHTGFKGTWMSEMLCQLGADVGGYSLPVESDSFYSKAKPDVKRSISGNIVDYDSLFTVVKDFHPDIIIHLASHSSLYGSMDIPHKIISTNLMGVENVLECARLVESVKSVVIVTSDKVYADNGNNVIYTEKSSLDADDPYGTSKVCQELLAKCYRNTFTKEGDGFKIVTARASNCISIGDDNNSRLFPYVLQTLSNGELPEIRHKDAIRSWQYVLDVLYGYLLLAKKVYEATDVKAVSEAYNFGPGEDGMKSVGYVVSRMCHRFDIKGFTETNEGDNIPTESTILQIDSTLAEGELGWKRKVDLNNAIDRIVDMTKILYNGECVKNVVSEEVRKYLSK